VDYVEGSIDRLELFNTPDARYSTAVVSHNGETRTQYVKDADLTDDELPGLTSPDVEVRRHGRDAPVPRGERAGHQ